LLAFGHHRSISVLIYLAAYLIKHLNTHKNGKS
jgi:hypothetical protein